MIFSLTRIVWILAGTYFLMSEPAAARGRFYDFDVVLDIDETTFGRFVDPARSGLTPEHYVNDARGRIWRVLHGLPEALLVLEKLGARVSFFSAYYKPERNPQILQNLFLPDGRTAWDLSDGRVFGADEIHYFDGKKSKDLSLVEPRDMRRTILVDNDASYSFPGQESNLLWLPTHSIEAFENSDLDRFDMVSHLIGRHQFRSARSYLEKIEAQYLIDENKPVIMLGILMAALEKSENENLSLRQAIKLLQMETFGSVAGDSQAFFEQRENLRPFLEKGVHVIREFVDPYFEAMGPLEGLDHRARFRRQQVLAKLDQDLLQDVRTLYHEDCQVLFGGESYQ